MPPSLLTAKAMGSLQPASSATLLFAGVRAKLVAQEHIVHTRLCLLKVEHTVTIFVAFCEHLLPCFVPAFLAPVKLPLPPIENAALLRWRCYCCCCCCCCFRRLKCCHSFRDVIHWCGRDGNYRIVRCAPKQVPSHSPDGRGSLSSKRGAERERGRGNGKEDEGGQRGENEKKK